MPYCATATFLYNSSGVYLSDEEPAPPALSTTSIMGSVGGGGGGGGEARSIRDSSRPPVKFELESLRNSEGTDIFKI